MRDRGKENPDNDLLIQRKDHSCKKNYKNTKNNRIQTYKPPR